MLSEFQLWIDAGISVESNGITGFIFLALGGLLASLLPCVYPLYPITAGILQKRSSEKKWLHPSIYYLGLSTAYLAFGVVAGLTGGAFNTFLRLPVFNFGLFWVFLGLALSSVDLLPIRFFGSQFEFKSKEGVLGTFLLGIFAGILSSPCVGPVVVAILIKIISSQSSGLLWGEVFFAALKMFIFGLGLGVPFLLIGVFGTKLPKAGKWMKFVQYGMSLLILFFSFQYLDKAISIASFASNSAELIFLGTITAMIILFFIQPEEYSIYEKIRRSYLIAALIFLISSLSVYILTQSLSRNQTTPSLEILDSNQNTEQLQKGNLVWFRNERDALSLARREGKLIFIDFYADWCTNCKEFDKLTLSNPDLNTALQSAVLWKVYDTDVLFESFSEDPRFPELRIGLPFFVIQTPDGVVIYKSNNYLDTKGMIEALKSK